MEDTAIPSVVKRLLEDPELFAVSANVVNNPALSWVHYHLGAYLPFWPVRSASIAPPLPVLEC